MKGTITIGKRGVKLPIFAILAAIPEAVEDAAESAADNHDPDSPGGEKVTPEEVLQDVGAFFEALAKGAAPAILRANGLK